MGNIRVRKETGKLLLDFHFGGVRFREQTALCDNASNRKKVGNLLERVEAKIKLGEFNYADHFPGSRNIEKFQTRPRYQKSKGELATYWFAFFIACLFLFSVTVCDGSALPH